MIHIHRVSKNTIGLLAETETNKYSHAYLDLVGTVEEVNKAEELILNKVLKVKYLSFMTSFDYIKVISIKNNFSSTL